MAAPPPLIALKNARLGYGGRPLFDGIDVQLTAGDKAVLVGRNGSGKSTLMKALGGLVDLDSGERFVQPGTRVAYLEQEPDLAGHATIADYVADGLPADRRADAWRVDAALAPVGLDGGRPTAGLSGGEARRAALARLIAGDPDVLLLDEPTNHLDLPTIEWLEDWLGGFRGALLLISHDRRFLERLGRRMLWLDRGRLHVTDRGFDAFDTWTAEIGEAEEKAADRLDKKIASETHWLREGLTARRKRNMGRVRELQRMREERRARVARPGVAKLDPAEAKQGGTLVLEAEGLVKDVPGPDGPRRVVDGFSTRLVRGDRVGVIGPNGAGKTTLVRMLIGSLAPDAGTVRLGPTVEPVYFDQTRASLDAEARVRDVLLPEGGDRLQVGDRMVHIASYLRDFLFDPSRMESPLKSLSGGERNRLLLARLFARPSNLMVLDEPTNDLDMETLDLLEEVLADYAGTLILVSHDRDFLDRLVTSIVAVEGDGRIDETVGGYEDHLRQRGSAPAGGGRPDRTTAPQATPAPKPKKPQTKLSYKEQRALDHLPGEVEALEAEIARLTAELADPGLYTRDPARARAATERLEAAQAEKTEKEDRWLALAEKAEALA
ncbi:MAG: ATP-binding cassette domain-containing protein [Alphaproteobacteria bacterium]|jgi:ATP-binding cassette subfamily F protein uup|nr:ATP-binding cassette domain-containing protein [Alphaproteobacteria bacterium]